MESIKRKKAAGMIQVVTFAQHVGGRIRRRRHERGMTLRELGEATGINYAHLSEVENGKYCIGLEKMHSISQVLGRSIDWFTLGYVS